MERPAVGLKLPSTDDRPNRPAIRSAGDWGERAEDLGYDSIWMGEAWGADSLMSLAEVATRTEEIDLCTAIVSTFSRTPATLAMAGTTLQRLSGGRAVLGVGASHASIVEPLHGLAYERPVRRTHEAIELIKALAEGSGDITYDGEIFHVEGYPAFETPLPVYNAALGDANRRATGRVADGWLPYLFPVSALEDGFESVAEAARGVGRDPATIEVTPQILAATSDDPEESKDAIRDYVASYIGELPNYRSALAEWYPAECRAIGEAWNSGDGDAARDAVSDELLFDLGVAGTPETARSQLRDILELPVVDRPIVYVPRSGSAELLDRTVEALGPDRL